MAGKAVYVHCVVPQQFASRLKLRDCTMSCSSARPDSFLMDVHEEGSDLSALLLEETPREEFLAISDAETLARALIQAISRAEHGHAGGR